MASDSNLRLLWLCSDLESSNGWGSYARGLAESLIARGVNLRILVSRHQTDSSLDGAEVIPCLTSPLAPMDRPTALVWNAYQMARWRGDSDLIHAIVEPYALGARTPGAAGHIITLHGTYAVAPFREGMLTRWAFARALRTARKVVCVSQYTRSRLLEKIDLPDVCVIPNGAKLPQDVTPAPRSRSAPLLLGVGAVKRRKGYHVTIEAVSQLKDEFPSLKYAIVGDTSDRRYVESLRRQIGDLHLEQQVTLEGRLDDAELRALYREASIFVLTPVNTGVAFEGFGLTYLEAGAYSLPVIGSLGCGAEDAIIDGETGYLVPQESPEQIAALIRSLLLDPGLAESLGARGQEHARSFAWDHVAESYLDVYNTALER
ncbi:MAG TPA: glycosyltransferase family 4 protein [Chloroflexota bacterium]|nr:glycosyltransferase family 4 protein [Chloroflexota bacterium]